MRCFNHDTAYDAEKHPDGCPWCKSEATASRSRAVLATATDLEAMKRHLSEYRERLVTSAAADAEIKKLIGE